jgi:DNA polymerase III subunit beta
MKIICTKENLSNILSLLSSVASKNINLPILNNVLIKAEEQKVSLITTNLELAITAQVRAKVEKPGSFTVPAKTLSDFVNLLSEETVELEVEENELKITCGKSSTKIKGVPSEDFPVVPTTEDGQGYLLDSDELKHGLDKVIQSAAKNDIRPELAGILFDFVSEKKQLIMASTDSYRLAEKKIKIDQCEKDMRVVVPARTAQEINRVLTINKNIGGEEKSVRVILSENQIVVRNNDVELVSRLVEGKYPDYTQIIPENFNTTVSTNVDKLSKEIKAASLFTTAGVNAVVFTAKPDKDGLEVSSSSTQAGEHRSEVNADVSGNEVSTMLNHRYVLDGLGNINTDDCVIKIVNSDSPCLFASKEDDSYLYIVMPIRQ